MRKLSYIIAALIAVPLLWVTASSHAQDHRGRGPQRQLRGLDLSPEQRQQVEAIHHRTAKKSVQQQADLRLAQLELAELMRAEEPARKKIHAQLEQIAQLQAALRITQVDQQLDVRQLLTPEQRQEMAERAHKRGGRHGRWGDREGPRRGRGGRWGERHEGRERHAGHRERHGEEHSEHGKKDSEEHGEEHGK